MSVGLATRGYIPDIRFVEVSGGPVATPSDDEVVVTPTEDTQVIITPDCT